MKFLFPSLIGIVLISLICFIPSANAIPSLTLYENTGSYPQQIFFDCSGFTSGFNENLSFGGTPISTNPMPLTINATGQCPANSSFIVPNVAQGLYDVEIFDGTDNATVNNFRDTTCGTSSAAITINPTTGPINTLVSINGSGYNGVHGQCYSSTNSQLSGNKIWLQKFNNLPVGANIFKMEIPYTNYNPYGYQFYGKIYNGSNSEADHLISENYSAITTGSSPSTYTIGLNATVPSNGIIWAGFVSLDTGGTDPGLNFASIGETSNSHYENYAFGSGPTTFTSSGATSTLMKIILYYTLNSDTVKVYWNGGNYIQLSTIPASPINIDANGTFHGTFFSPSDGGVNHEIDAQSSITGFDPVFDYFIYPSIIDPAIPTSGAIGDPIYINFNFLNANGTASINFGGTSISNSTVTLNSTGGWQGTVLVPSGASNTINVNDGINPTISTAFSISGPIIDPAIPTSGYVGDSVYLNVNQFNPNGTLSIKFSSVSISNSTVTLNSTGGWQGTVLVPIGIPFNTGLIDFNDGFSPGSTPFNVLNHNIIISSFTLNGVLQSNIVVFSDPTMYLISPSAVNVTQLQLSNSSMVIDTHNFSPPFLLSANILTSIPWSFNTTGSGSQIYKLDAAISSPFNFTTVQSNSLTITYNNALVLGNQNYNQTNPNILPIRFNYTKINGTTSDLGVIYQNTFNMDCNFLFQFAQLNKTYGNLTSVPYSSGFDLSNFVFKNVTNDIINVKCWDIGTNTTGKYVITQTNLPLVDQIKNFRNGTYGTQGQFGVLDMVTLLVIIIAMIGLNRVNDAAGVIFAIMVLGSFAYFGIIEWPTIFLGALAIVLVVAITTTRKIIGG